MVEHLEGQLQEAHELVNDVQAQVQALADIKILWCTNLYG